ncbi:unnamed protein product [Musa hybrid cultivar]
MATSLPAHALGDVLDWWEEMNNSTLWQDRIFHALAALFGLVSAVALVIPQIQLVRTEFRVPEFGWTIQKVFHFLNLLVNGVRSLVFIFRRGLQIKPEIIQHFLLDLPGLAFFTTYALLVLFWAEIYLFSLKWNVMQTHLISTDGLRPCFYTINAMVYAIQVMT